LRGDYICARLGIGCYAQWGYSNQGWPPANDVRDTKVVADVYNAMWNAQDSDSDDSEVNE